MSEPGASRPLVRELNTGIVIAGAYATKVRRTLFAQLKNDMKNDKELAKEAARASAELNRILYHVLVESLRVDKGDAVRVRVRYRVDAPSKKIVFDYNTLTVEIFKKVSDEQVSPSVKKVLEEKLEEVKKQYATPPVAEKAEELLKPQEVQGVQQPPEVVSGIELLKNVKSIDLLGETISDGLLFKILDHNDQSIGILTLEPSDRGSLIDALILVRGKGFRYLKISEKGKDVLADNPDMILQELGTVKPVEVGSAEAERLIHDKTSSII